MEPTHDGNENMARSGHFDGQQKYPMGQWIAGMEIEDWISKEG
jgi:hypothetical protein